MWWLIFFQDLFKQYLSQGDLAGFITAVYADLIGEFWFIFPLTFIFLPLYIKTGSIEFVAVLWILTGAILTSMLPIQAMQTGTILLVLGIAVILYRIVKQYVV